MARKKGNKFFVTLVFIALISFAGYYVYQKYFASTIVLKNKNYTFIYIENKDEFEDVIQDINTENIIENVESFEWLAKKMELDKNIHPGKYRITNGMTMRQIINLIKYNKQEKVKLTFNYQIHNLDEFISYTNDKLELSENELEDFFSDEEKLNHYFKLDPENAFACITPAIYQVSWAISLNELMQLLKEKYYYVWNKNRVKQTNNLGYSIPQLITIASIVQSESSIKSEQEKIAGVYINRLKKEMLLQADPTLKFANKNYEAQRVLDKDKEINSPYNTYRFKGLPPGPICLVTTQAIDATLNYKKHNFIFFCAKPQLNGYSDFSINYSQHKNFASAYQKTLNKRGINK
jgi:UPF0755 protein